VRASSRSSASSRPSASFRPSASARSSASSRPSVSARSPFRRVRIPVTAVALTLAAVVLGACASGSEDPEPTGLTDEAVSDRLAVAVASFDLHVRDDARLLAGLYTPERQLVAFGEVTFQLGYLGDEAGGETELTQQAMARYLPIPGMEPEGNSDEPTLLADASGSGVYEARVELDEPGNWGLRVVAELDDGRTLEGQAVFPVLPEAMVPDVGDEAPRVDNHTLDDVADGRVRPIALDSRAQDDATPVEEIPDPHLHTHTVAGSLDEGRPVLLSVATPVYCVSRFCGPLTSVVSELAIDYEDVVDTVQIEVWEDFDEQTLNDAAAAWIQTDIGGNEPWVFLIHGDGTVAARWDNVLDVDELRDMLDELPSLPAAEAAGS
jgi:hypothetical protein